MSDAGFNRFLCGGSFEEEVRVLKAVIVRGCEVEQGPEYPGADSDGLRVVA